MLMKEMFFQEQSETIRKMVKVFNEMDKKILYHQI